MTLLEQQNFYFGPERHWRILDANCLLRKIDRMEDMGVGQSTDETARNNQNVKEMERAKQAAKIAAEQGVPPYNIA